MRRKAFAVLLALRSCRRRPSRVWQSVSDRIGPRTEARSLPGWKDSWYWLITTLERIARDDETAAMLIRERMDALQDEICASGAMGDPAAEICRRETLGLLSEFGRQTRNLMRTEML